MEYKDLASVSGKGGLYRVIKPTRTGVILETMDEKKQRFMAGMHQRVSLLNEISIYTTTQEGSTPLENVFQTIYNEFGNDTGLDSGSDQDELKSFLKHILPEYDEERVYPSDIKKLIVWYDILLNCCPEIFTKDPERDKEKE